MRKFLTGLAAIAVLTAGYGSAQAEESYENTTAAFRKFCADQGDNAMFGVCLGQISGIIASYQLFGVEEQKLFCRPAEATRGQQLKAVTDYMDDHTELGKVKFGYVVILALNASWPCEGGPKLRWDDKREAVVAE